MEHDVPFFLVGLPGNGGFCELLGLIMGSVEFGRYIIDHKIVSDDGSVRSILCGSIFYFSSREKLKETIAETVCV